MPFDVHVSGAQPSPAPRRRLGAGLPSGRASPAAAGAPRAAQPAAAEPFGGRPAAGGAAVPHAPESLWHSGAGHRLGGAQDGGRFELRRESGHLNDDTVYI